MMDPIHKNDWFPGCHVVILIRGSKPSLVYHDAADRVGARVAALLDLHLWATVEEEPETRTTMIDTSAYYGG